MRRARRLGYAVAIEDLSKLWHSKASNDSRLAWLLSRFAYRKLQQAIAAKSVEYNVPVVVVDPRGTSTKCTICSAKLLVKGRSVYCPGRGLRLDRDYAAAINIHSRALTVLTGMRGARVPLTAGPSDR